MVILRGLKNDKTHKLSLRSTYVRSSKSLDYVEDKENPWDLVKLLSKYREHFPKEYKSKLFVKQAAAKKILVSIIFYLLF